MYSYHEYLVMCTVVLSNINQWRNLSVYGKPDYETQSGVSFIFPLFLGHSFPKNTDSFTTASSWSLFSDVSLQLTLQ